MLEVVDLDFFRIIIGRLCELSKIENNKIAMYAAGVRPILFKLLRNQNHPNKAQIIMLLFAVLTKEHLDSLTPMEMSIISNLTGFFDWSIQQKINSVLAAYRAPQSTRVNITPIKAVTPTIPLAPVIPITESSVTADPKATAENTLSPPAIMAPARMEPMIQPQTKATPAPIEATLAPTIPIAISSVTLISTFTSENLQENTLDMLKKNPDHFFENHLKTMSTTELTQTTDYLLRKITEDTVIRNIFQKQHILIFGSILQRNQPPVIIQNIVTILLLLARGAPCRQI